MKNPNAREWRKSGITESLINLNLEILTTEEIAEWFFQYLPHSARRNDGRIREGYLKAYANPLKGGWGIKGYDPLNLEAEPELRTFKADNPRLDKNGKIIRYDAPKNSKHYPILPRVSYEIASIVCRQAGVNFLAMTEKYAPLELVTGVDDEAECRWFWRMILDNPQIPLTITEGGKKCLALLSQGRCAVAVTSITTWRAEKGSNKLHSWLVSLVKDRRNFIAYDQDHKKTTQWAVNTQALKLGNAIIKAGAIRVKRLSWTGTAKGIDDYIYNTQQRYGNRYLQKILRKCYENARHYRLFNKSNSLPGQIKIVNKRYLDVNDLKEAAGFKIVAIKSAKGSGKTLLLSLLTAADRDSGIPTINLSYLERLSREQGIRSGIPYRTQKDSVSIRNAIGYSLCIDSFTPDNSIPFIPEQWADSGLTIDEFTQVFRHSAFGTTELKNYRSLVLDTLAKKLADCWANNKPIRLLDADADVESMELVYELIQLYSEQPITREELEAKTFTLINEYRPKKGDCYVYNEPSPKQILCDLKKLMEKQENLLILSSSQKSRSADGTINLEKKALKYYKQSEILRIDSQTTKDPNHPAFGLTGEELTKLIKGESVVNQTVELPSQLHLLEREKVTSGLRKVKLDKIKIVIASPTICTGISIEQLDGYFSGVFSIQAGNITPNSVRQQLVRLRDFQVPRYIWCPKVGKNFVGSKSTNPIELLTDQKGEAGLSFKLLGYPQAERLIESNVCPLTKYWAKVGAQQNRDNYNYREILRTDLEEEGWHIIDRYPDENNEELKIVWEERKEIRETSIQQETEALVNAEEITPEQAMKFEGKKDLTSSQERQLKKHQLKQTYGVEEVSPELVEADSKKLYPTMRLRFWLKDGRPYVEVADRARLEKLKARSGGKLFIPDVNKITNIARVKLLETCNLDKFLEEGREWNNHSPELIELSKFVFKDLIRFNQLLRCGIAITDSPITVVQKILKQINQRLPYLRNERDRDKRLRIYGAASSRFEGLEQEETQMLAKWLKQCQEKFDTPEVA